ncbi:hypothetical protein [Mammaliicoccus fleurettii]|uniref:hypothetical protein n=1 Tax=Mammaliicoccus fleurettii TaxID=150056 RepID=UPI001AACD5E2|nr:hypothetical protein [Mammaliicoccus fleurettii]MBO3062712.1 hypothetical protein [Mammaliicoccus fleurettii]
MNEPTEFKYPLDEYGEPYFAGSHIDAIEGMQEYKDEINQKFDSIQTGGSTNDTALKALEQKVNNLIGDTGWTDFQVAPTYKKNQGVVGGFNCGIREIRVGTIVIKSIRLNLGKINNNEQIAQLPIGFITKTQTFISRSNSNDNGVQFSARDDGSVYGYVNKADQALSSDRWVYYEHTWLE